MVIISPVDDLASSHPLAGADAAAPAGGAPQPAAASHPESLFQNLAAAASHPESLFQNLAAAAYVPSTPAWSSHPPPYAPTPTTAGGFNPSSSSLFSASMTMDAFLAQPPPAMAEPPYYYYPTTMQGFHPYFVQPPPFGQAPPPVMVPMQNTMADPSFYPQTQGAAAAASASAAAAEEEAVIVHEPLPDTQKAAQEATAPTRRPRGRPRKNAAAAAAASKPAFKPPNKRATARSKRAASSQQKTSVTASAAAANTTMSGQVQAQEPDQAAGVVAGATTDGQTAPCTNLMPPLLYHQEQRQLQSICSNRPSAGCDQAAVAAGQEVMVPYADTNVPGVRFDPTNEELIFFLRLKHAGQKMPVDFFKDVDVYHVHPETTKAVCGESENGCWYAFSPRDRKYKFGVRPARSVFDEAGEQVGYWKSNTKLATVRVGDKDNGALIGKVTALTFHLGRQPNGTQTPWKMKEYSIPENQHAPDGSVMRLNDWVVCKLFYKERRTASEKEGQSGEAGENVELGEAGENVELGEAGLNVGQEGGEEGTSQMVSTGQTLGNSEQDLRVEDYLTYLGYDETFAQ